MTRKSEGWLSGRNVAVVVCTVGLIAFRYAGSGQRIATSNSEGRELVRMLQAKPRSPTIGFDNLSRRDSRESAPLFGSEGRPHSDVDACWGHSLARDFRQSKGNVFADVDDVLQNALARDDNTVAHLALTLANPPLIGSGWDESSDMTTQVLLERMAMIDLLEAFGRRAVTEESQISAFQELRGLVLGDLPPSISESQKIAMVAEKYDSLVALSRLDPLMGMDTMQRLSRPEAKETLFPAIMTALVERGVPRGDVQAHAKQLQELLAVGSDTSEVGVR